MTPRTRNRILYTLETLIFFGIVCVGLYVWGAERG